VRRAAAASVSELSCRFHEPFMNGSRCARSGAIAHARMRDNTLTAATTSTERARPRGGPPPEGKLAGDRPMFPLMLIDTPDDRYRGRPERSWRRVLRLLAGAVACFLVGALVLPWVGFALYIGGVVLVLLALCALDD
jgi:hypothetical protein